MTTIGTDLLTWGNNNNELPERQLGSKLLLTNYLILEPGTRTTYEKSF